MGYVFDTRPGRDFGIRLHACVNECCRRNMKDMVDCGVRDSETLKSTVCCRKGSTIKEITPHWTLHQSLLHRLGRKAGEDVRSKKGGSGRVVVTLEVDQLHFSDR